MTMSSHTERWAELLHSKSETTGLFSNIISLLKDLLHCHVVVFKLSDDKQRLTPMGLEVEREHHFAEQVVSDLSSPLSYALFKREDLLIPNLSTEPRFVRFSDTLRGLPWTSTIVRRIRPVNGFAWGCLGVFFNLPQYSVEQRRRAIIR